MNLQVVERLITSLILANELIRCTLMDKEERIEYKTSKGMLEREREYSCKS